MDDEVWKPIPKYPLYLVSNRGRVASIMALQLSSARRYVVQVTEGTTKGRKGTGRLPKTPIIVHRAVLEAFVGPPPTVNSVCRHKNDVPNDNRLENLEWGSKSDNAQDAIRNGRWGINENSVKAKLSNEDVQTIRGRYIMGIPLKDIAAEFGVHATHIYGIVKRKFWKHLPEDATYWEWVALEEVRNDRQHG